MALEERVPLQQLYKDTGSLKNLPLVEQKFYQKSFSNGEQFPNIPTPGKHDWLSDHDEQFQSVEDWKRRVINQIHQTRRGNKVVYLVPIGRELESMYVRNGDQELKFLQSLQNFAATFFRNFQVKVVQSADVAGLQFRGRLNTYTGKPQIYIPDIYKYLESLWPSDAYCVVGITMKDLYPKDDWNFVFGQAFITKGIGVFSFARYNPSFYEEDVDVVLSREIHPVVFWRSCKVMCHEISHLFGLSHCVYFHCAMNGSNHLAEANRRPAFLCPVCLRKLQIFLKFGIKDRYLGLKEFFEKFEDPHFVKAKLWIEKSLQTFKD